MTGSLDREVKDVYPVVVQAIDRGQPPLTGQAVVYVRVTDVNDESPYFVPSIPKGDVLEGSPANTQVLRLDDFTYDDDIAPNQVGTISNLLAPNNLTNMATTCVI